MDAVPELVEPGGGPADELCVDQPGRDDLPGQRVGQGDVAADLDPQPLISPLRTGRAARVDDVHARSVANASQYVMEEDRVRNARIGTPQDDEIGVLDVAI